MRTHIANLERWDTTKVLIEKAKMALQYATPRLSHFRVGAAGLAVNKNREHVVVAGWKNEARHGDALHAEESMVAKLVEGEVLLRVVILGENQRPLAPCGNCREVLATNARPDTEVLVQKSPSDLAWLPLVAFLPKSFDSNSQVSSLTEEADELRLFRIALKMMNDRPYSPYLVGTTEAAAAMTLRGRIVSATGIQDAAYHHLTAVEAMIALADAERDRTIHKVLYLTPRGGVEPVFPDGRSRQKLFELSQVGGLDFTVLAANPTGQLWFSTASKLLPFPFGPLDLGIDVTRFR